MFRERTDNAVKRVKARNIVVAEQGDIHGIRRDGPPRGLRFLEGLFEVVTERFEDLDAGKVFVVRRYQFPGRNVRARVMRRHTCSKRTLREISVATQPRRMCQCIGTYLHPGATVLPGI